VRSTGSRSLSEVLSDAVGDAAERATGLPLARRMLEIGFL